jgi:DNA-binding response OmpR family regulator
MLACNRWSLTVRIAYLEDDMAQAELVTHWLKEAGHNCIHMASGRDFMSLLRRDTFDILVLDWEVPDMNGYAVLEEVRASGNRTPVLFATQRDDESSIVGALSQGADDYMVKPTKQAELLARISALGRRAGVSEMDEETTLNVGPWTVDRSRRQILLDEEAIKLTDKD